MNVRKRITDYPAIFWAALAATIVGGWMSVHAYHAMLHSDDALIRSIGIFVTLECVSIFAAATLNTRGQGLLVGMAFVLIVGCAGTEIFLGASELQRGIMQMTETAKAASASTANGTANAGALATAQEGLKGCQTRYPRKKKDAQARAECSKSYEKSIAALTAGEPAKTVQFNPEAAGMLALWQGITDAYNAMMGKEGDTAAKVEQVAFIAMVSIFTVFVIGKLFLWSKYAAWKTANYGDDYRSNVTVSEHAIGNPETVAESATTEATSQQPEKQPFGFTGSKSPAASSADRNRALHARVDTRSDDLHARVNTRPCNNTHDPLPARVNTRPCNNTHDDLHAAYTHAADANAGEHVNCPQCGTVFRKVNKQHTFCQKTCKDEWWNTKDPSRLEALKALKRRNGKAA